MLNRFFFLSTILAPSVLALQSYQSRIPNGDNVVSPSGEPWPGVGHHRSSGGGERNAFGDDFAAAGHEWTIELCQMDSDCDGFTNGQELGDPDCVWMEGEIPQFDVGITHPGIADTERTSGSTDAISDSCSEFDFAELPPDYSNTSFVMPNFLVPSERTTYAKFAFHMEDLGLDQDAYAVRVEPLLENSQVVHHMILYHCDEEPTGFIDEPSTEGRMPCRDMVMSWAVGGKGLCLPAQVGIELLVAEPWFVMEVHYDNPQGLTGIYDNSGLKITSIPQSDSLVADYQPAGWLWAGGLPLGMNIPPGEEAYEIMVECGYPSIPQSGVTVFAYALHAHTLGRKVWTEVHRPMGIDSQGTSNVQECPEECSTRLFGQCELCFAQQGCCGDFDDASKCVPTGQCCDLCKECDGCQGCYPQTDTCNPNGFISNLFDTPDAEYESLLDLGCDTRYDFDLQETRNLAEYQTIYPTDKLVTHCVYDSTERSTVTKGGDATEDEMCIGFFLYYPVQPNMKCLKRVEQDVGTGEKVCQMPGVEVYNDTSMCADGERLDGAGVSSGVSFSDMDAWLQIHILCMMLSMGILIPVGVLIPLAFRLTLFKRNDAWFRYHRILQTIGLLLLLTGVCAAFQGSSATSFSETHHKLGLTIFILALSQPINAVLRPHKPENGESPSLKRRAWEVLHKGVGYSTVVLAWVNIFLGIDLLEEWYSASDDLVSALTFTQSVFMGVVFLGGIVGITMALFASKKQSNEATIQEGEAVAPNKTTSDV
uniref:Cytochrome b561 domain-containing protein n=1 Tax=Entomoneis paludosa TaxID=265537 RepID=A0A6U3CPA2_9STRA|mmetsp:Transcript_31777/g.66321  ORF Transcript_31777/g.66321 Transcript_31777/m.66321 type:complete len:764 (+) Transcript_31777:292-2583(+)|eukprot:CAMPEP_0172467984 /NCGR_PEP_ID=MMETSP1065-20121228/60323_1 /TAXON_ID=265537 /ORGANISM="Amphiprora paludosa, Strain CCMP125" /LENGTH=763 /DNA_ID=CAMNT_0013225279 /DNA_START=164 /DNA_END=2455 /DNA_ORIENTATION=+